MSRVLVVGTGIAGTAAALVAARAGATVSVVALGPSASRLSGGAFDLEPWQDAGEDRPLEPDVLFVLDALGIAALPTSALVATSAGILRRARATDPSLLNLAQVRDGEVLVVGADLSNWDESALARAWTDTPEAHARNLRFVARSVPLVRYVEERDSSDADMAKVHDAPERLDWLSGRLASALGANRPTAVVFPPWLGVDAPVAQVLSTRIGLPCGEALTGLAGPSGLRFERARDRALDAANVRRSVGRVAALGFDGGWHARLDSGDSVEPVDAVVLALGGLVGGGLAYTPSGAVLATELPPAASPIVRITVEAPLEVGVDERPLESASSLFGAAPESHAWPFVDDSVLERAGVLVDSNGQARGAPPGVFAAGDFVADRPRTWLEALALGARAGLAAAGTR